MAPQWRLSVALHHLTSSGPHAQPRSAAAAASSVLLWPDGAPDSSDGGVFQPSLDIRLHPSATKPLGAVLIMPGGGYGGRATDHEGYQIAERCNRAGYHAFILQYRVSPNVHPAPLLDASRALRLIRAHATEWGVVPDQIAVMGFSAGGEPPPAVRASYALAQWLRGSVAQCLCPLCQGTWLAASASFTTSTPLPSRTPWLQTSPTAPTQPSSAILSSPRESTCKSYPPSSRRARVTETRPPQHRVLHGLLTRTPQVCA